MYLGNQPALAYTSFAKQDFTTSATTSYTLDNPVANENEIALFINFVRQEPTTAYTASGTSLTLTSATSASDDMYCVFLGKAVQTVNPPAGSVGISQLSATGTKDATTFLRGDNTFAQAGGGKLLQAVSATETSSRSTTSTSFVTASNTLSVDITPASTSNNILIMVSIGYVSIPSGNSLQITLYKDNTTNLGSSNGFVWFNGGGGEASQSFHVYDSPSTTSSTNYQVYFKVSGGTGQIGSSIIKSTITAMEIEG